MNSRGGTVSVRLLILTVIVFLSGFTGCTSRLPGTAECEQMAVRLVFPTTVEMRNSPAKQRLVQMVTNGCITTPFDHQAVSCVATSRNLPLCMDALMWRAPERRAAVERLLQGAVEGTWRERER